MVPHMTPHMTPHMVPHMVPYMVPHMVQLLGTFVGHACAERLGSHQSAASQREQQTAQHLLAIVWTAVMLRIPELALSLSLSLVIASILLETFNNSCLQTFASSSLQLGHSQ